MTEMRSTCFLACKNMYTRKRRMDTFLCALVCQHVAKRNVNMASPRRSWSDVLWFAMETIDISRYEFPDDGMHLGLLFNQRSEPYQSGTMKGFAVATGSNTHTAPNYRLPVNAKTHDPLCYNEHCLAAIAKEARAVWAFRHLPTL